MDNVRIFLIFALLMVSLLLWEAWQKDYVRPQQQIAQKETTTDRSTLAPTTQQQRDLPDMPITKPKNRIPAHGKQDANSNNWVHIKTDVLDLHIDTQGGDIQELALLNYPAESNKPHIVVQFLNNTTDHFFVVQSGLRSDKVAPTHYEQYSAEQYNYELTKGQNQLVVPLYWQAENGLRVTKIYRFKRNSYLVDVNYVIENNSGDVFSAYPYAQFNRNQPQGNSGFIYTYTGAVFSSPYNQYEKIDFDDLDDSAFNRKATTGWSAMLQHYFVAALIPPTDAQEIDLYGRSINKGNYIAGIKMPTLRLKNGDSGQTSYQIYLGPKEHQRLEKVADNLDLTVDYGKLTIISQPLFMVMEWIHSLTNNWGWSIVFLTVLIKLVFYRLSATSYRSMAAMRKLTPKLTALKEQFGNDKQKFNKAMMNLYRTEKINPLGGCLPILVQMPVFLAFYWVLVESIELRQAPFIFWLQDLTAIDPYFILPLLFGLSMFFQQKLNPVPHDPAQAMVMKIFPIVFTVFFAFFPSGLVLYWVVNNILSIAQQWYITRKMGAL